MVTRGAILASIELLTLASTVERSECVQQVQGMQDLLSTDISPRSGHTSN